MQEPRCARTPRIRRDRPDATQGQTLMRRDPLAAAGDALDLGMVRSTSWKGSATAAALRAAHFSEVLCGLTSETSEARGKRQACSNVPDVRVSAPGAGSMSGPWILSRWSLERGEAAPVRHLFAQGDRSFRRVLGRFRLVAYTSLFARGHFW